MTKLWRKTNPFISKRCVATGCRPLMEPKSLISTRPEYFHSPEPCSVQLVFLFKQAFTPECWNRSDFDAVQHDCVCVCVWGTAKVKLFSKNKKSTFTPSLNPSGVFMRKRRTLTWARDGAGCCMWSVWRASAGSNDFLKSTDVYQITGCSQLIKRSGNVRNLLHMMWSLDITPWI